MINILQASWLSIFKHIFRTVLQGKSSHGASQTKIMYSAFLSYTQVKEYLTILIDNGLLAST
jgi:predicted transcriptional regulator